MPHRPGVCAAGLGAGAVRHRARDAGLPERNGQEKERLIEITADGQISSDEIDDFIRIRQELERISVTVETLQLWTERMLANGQIDAEAYKAKLSQP